MKEIKGDINRWRDIPCSWVRRINIVQMTILTKCNLQMQCDPYQITNGIFRELEQKHSEFIWKHKRPQIAKAVLRKKRWSWRNHRSRLQVILQSYSHQDSMVLAQKQKYRLMEQERKPRNKSTHLWVPYF